jgi:hypothetical protein
VCILSLAVIEVANYYAFVGYTLAGHTASTCELHARSYNLACMLFALRLLQSVGHPTLECMQKASVPPVCSSVLSKPSS